jgi:hypothetical protein
VLDGAVRSSSHPCSFNPEETDPGKTVIGGSVDPRAYLDLMLKKKILTPAGNRTPTPRRPVHRLAAIFFINELYIILKLFLISSIHKLKSNSSRTSNKNSDRNHSCGSLVMTCLIILFNYNKTSFLLCFGMHINVVLVL